MERYQDYVIKDGKFIGKFEEMYQKFEDPWNQLSGLEQSYMRQLVSCSIQKYKIKSLLEVGCGFGVTTNYIKCCNPNLLIAGIDISETAIEKARKYYKDINFMVGNIAEYKEDLREYDAIFFSEIMWYILNDLEKIISNLNEYYKGRLVIINQTFYKSGIQQYGKEYFTNIEEMCEYLPWKCLKKVIEENSEVESIATHSVFRIE